VRHPAPLHGSAWPRFYTLEGNLKAPVVAWRGMNDVISALQHAVEGAVAGLGAPDVPVLIQEVPEGRPGDYGTAVAFTLAKALGRNPAGIAADIVAATALPEGVASASAVGPYINFTVEPAAFLRSVTLEPRSPRAEPLKVVVEHTSVNPNKEAHVGHLRNIVLGDATARLLKAVGHDVEVQNYIDDTGRQAAESIFAVTYFGARYGTEGGRKYDHWLGELYVRLAAAKETDGDAIERGVTEVMHRLERGELRPEVERVLKAQLETYHSLGADYDLLVWESDIVQGGLLQRGLEVMEASPHVSRPTEGKYAGALVMDVSEFLPGLEEPLVVLVRSDGNAMYVAKDIGYQFWKAGIFEGLTYERFAVQPSGKPLYTSSPRGELHPDGRSFAHAREIINVIDARQSHPQTIVRTALALSATPEGRAAFDHSHHLAYEVVTLEGQAMSGRKGITLSIDEVAEEATRRARAVVEEKNPGLKDVDLVARQVGIGALRFGMLKSEAKKVIDFRWEQALSLQGDSAPYVQYAHARACSILRAAAAAGLDAAAARAGADFGQLGPLEVRLARVLRRYADVVEAAAVALAPHSVAQYALDVATAWNSYYNHKDAGGRADTQVMRAGPGLREARLVLVDRVRATLAATLDLLGIAAPGEM